MYIDDINDSNLRKRTDSGNNKITKKKFLIASLCGKILPIGICSLVCMYKNERLEQFVISEDWMSISGLESCVYLVCGSEEWNPWIKMLPMNLRIVK